MRDLFFFILLFYSTPFIAQSDSTQIIRGYRVEQDTLYVFGKGFLNVFKFNDKGIESLVESKKIDVYNILDVDDSIYYVLRDRIVDKTNNLIALFKNKDQFSYPLKCIVCKNSIVIAFTQNIVNIYDLNFKLINTYDLRDLKLNRKTENKKFNSNILTYDVNIYDLSVKKLDDIYVCCSLGLVKFFDYYSFDIVDNSQNTYLTSLYDINDTIYAFGQNFVLIKPQNYNSTFRLNFCNVRSIVYSKYIKEFEKIFLFSDSTLYYTNDFIKFYEMQFSYKHPHINFSDIFYSTKYDILYLISESGKIFPFNIEDFNLVKKCKYPHILERSIKTHYTQNKTNNFIFRITENQDFKIWYDFGDNFEDRIIIREGQVERQGKVIFDSKFVKHLNYSKEFISSSEPFINIEINNKNVGRRTGWDFWFDVYPK